eukprot:scaffold136932_cov45-Prasinocladus_malaysianus.AAC.1
MLNGNIEDEVLLPLATAGLTNVRSHTTWLSSDESRASAAENSLAMNVNAIRADIICATNLQLDSLADCEPPDGSIKALWETISTSQTNGRQVASALLRVGLRREFFYC